MIYTVQKAKLITDQLRKFSTAHSWIVVGQFVNIDFWLEEVKSSINAIDEHNQRFEKMCASRKTWIDLHDIKIPNNCPICQGICEFGHKIREPRLPKKSGETNALKTESRVELINAAYFFLIRCYKVKLLNEDELRHKCNTLGTSVDFNDLIIDS